MRNKEVKKPQIKIPSLRRRRREGGRAKQDRMSIGRYLRPVLFAHTAQALGSGPVSAAIANAKFV